MAVNIMRVLKEVLSETNNLCTQLTSILMNSIEFSIIHYIINVFVTLKIDLNIFLILKWISLYYFGGKSIAKSICNNMHAYYF